MPVEYHLDHLDPVGFQRLVNALLTARYGEAIRVLPLRGKDGGRDAETAAGDVFELILAGSPSTLPGVRSPFSAGRYLFQFKHHRTTDKPPATVRSAVVSDFHSELVGNVLTRERGEAVDYFFLVTNVPGSRDAVSKIDERRREIRSDHPKLHADVLWQEHVISWLDQFPRVWLAFPEIFAGMRVPLLGQIASDSEQAGVPRSVRLALSAQFSRDDLVRFRQTNLERSLAKLFIDLDARSFGFETVDIVQAAAQMELVPYEGRQGIYYDRAGVSCIELLVSSLEKSRRLILQGGPGQGKSTVTQMLVQLYRALLLHRIGNYSHILPSTIKARFPIRIELRLFAEWLGGGGGSVEQFVAERFTQDSGGANVTPEQIHSLVEGAPVTIVFDGLDEVGSDDQRNQVVERIMDVVNRFEKDLKSDLRVVVTSRPPAIVGRANKLEGFVSAEILPLSKLRVDQYVARWVGVQCQDTPESERVRDSFEKRRKEVHVDALSKNPMQLSVLLHLIRLKGEAFPDRRAELYREYFRTVIDRDVEKSPELLRSRDDIEAIHEVLGLEIHSGSEGDSAKSSLSREELLTTIRRWLSAQNRRIETAEQLFALGEERLGLIVALRGEGAATRYGFEVQPVREYFAAAFINDKCEGNAHEIFQAMVRRTFWREVALFLAGLRRANEKADLLSRCRALDDDGVNGWRQDGRAVVLELLQGGVLTSPGHVYQEAVSFLLESLDPSDRRPRNEPFVLTAMLPKLMKGCDGNQHLRTLEQMLSKASRSSDRAVVERLYAVANKTLSERDLSQFLIDYSGKNAILAADVKLGWPAREGSLEMPIVADVSGILQEPASAAIASAWFATASVASKVTEIEQAPGYHELLFEQFAFVGMQLLPRRRPPVLSPIRHYAIWVLCSNLQRISKRISRIGEATPSPNDTGSVDYQYLAGNVKDAVRALVESSSEVVEALDRSSIASAIRPFLKAIEDVLGSDGLPGWIACRCGTTLIGSAEGPQYIFEHERGIVISAEVANLARIKAWTEMRRWLPPFFRSEIPTDLDRAGRTLAARIVQQGLHLTTPSHLRVNGRFESVPKLLAREVLGEQQLPWSWLRRVPIPQYWWADILDVEEKQLEPLLAGLSDREVTTGSPSPKIDIRKVREVLRAAKRSSDSRVPATALVALLRSKFVNLGTPRTVLGMISNDGDFADVAASLFQAEYGYRDSQLARKTLLAESIVRQEAPVSQSTAIAAARYLAQSVTANLPPLKSLGLIGETPADHR